MDSEENNIKESSTTKLDNGAQRNENCKVCQTSLPKYTCPRCMLKTCSLQCVKDHKARTGCTGVRDKTAYVSIKDFTERHLLSDYRFLEDTDRKCYSAYVDELNKPSFQKRKQKIIKECYKRGLTLKVLPHQFSKHKENTTIFVSRTKLLMWHVKWMFVHSDAEFTDKRLRENITLREALKSYLDPSVADPVIRHRLKKYSADLEDIMVLLKVENRPSNSVRYHLLNLERTLRDNLSGKTIIEYPTLHVILQKQAAHYTLLEQDDAEPVTNGKTEEVQEMPRTPKDENARNKIVQEQLPADEVQELQPGDTAEEHPPRSDTVQVDEPTLLEDNLEPCMEQDRAVDICVDPAMETVVNVNGDKYVFSEEQDMPVDISEDPALAEVTDVVVDTFRGENLEQQPNQNIGQENEIVQEQLPTDEAQEPQPGDTAEEHPPRIDAVQVEEPTLLEDNLEPCMEHDRAVDVSVDPATETVVNRNGEKDVFSEEQDMSDDISEDPAKAEVTDFSVDTFRGENLEQPSQNIGQVNQSSMEGDEKEYSEEQGISVDISEDPALARVANVSVDTFRGTDLDQQPCQNIGQVNQPSMGSDTEEMSVEPASCTETGGILDQTRTTEANQDIRAKEKDVSGDPSGIMATEQQLMHIIGTKRPAEKIYVCMDPTRSTEIDQQPEQKKQKLSVNNDHELPSVEQDVSVDVSEESAGPTETVISENTPRAMATEIIVDPSVTLDTQRTSEIEVSVSTLTPTIPDMRVSPTGATDSNVMVDTPEATENETSLKSPSAAEMGGCIDKPKAT